MRVVVSTLLAGEAVLFARGEASAIAKTPLTGVVTIGALGIEGDEQADPRYHGGPGKALHHYPLDHYDFWRAQRPGLDLLDAPGAFGENISTLGMTETDVCIGDQFALGSARIEISQGRQPCWKQGERLGLASAPALIVKHRCSGWYYRVIEPGVAQAGDTLELIARPLPEWSVARVFGLLIGGDHRQNRAALEMLVAMPQLEANWRERAAVLLKGHG